MYESEMRSGFLICIPFHPTWLVVSSVTPTLLLPLRKCVLVLDYFLSAHSCRWQYNSSVHCVNKIPNPFVAITTRRYVAQIGWMNWWMNECMNKWIKSTTKNNNQQNENRWTRLTTIIIIRWGQGVFFSFSQCQKTKKKQKKTKNKQKINKK